MTSHFKKSNVVLLGLFFLLAFSKISFSVEILVYPSNDSPKGRYLIFEASNDEGNEVFFPLTADIGKWKKETKWTERSEEFAKYFPWQDSDKRKKIRDVLDMKSSGRWGEESWKEFYGKINERLLKGDEKNLSIEFVEGDSIEFKWISGPGTGAVFPEYTNKASEFFDAFNSVEKWVNAKRTIEKIFDLPVDDIPQDKDRQTFYWIGDLKKKKFEISIVTDDNLNKYIASPIITNNEISFKRKANVYPSNFFLNLGVHHNEFSDLNKEMKVGVLFPDEPLGLKIDGFFRRIAPYNILMVFLIIAVAFGYLIFLGRIQFLTKDGEEKYKLEIDECSHLIKKILGRDAGIPAGVQEKNISELLFEMNDDLKNLSEQFQEIQRGKKILQGRFSEEIKNIFKDDQKLLIYAITSFEAIFSDLTVSIAGGRKFNEIFETNFWIDGSDNERKEMIASLKAAVIKSGLTRSEHNRNIETQLKLARKLTQGLFSKTHSNESGLLAEFKRNFQELDSILEKEIKSQHDCLDKKWEGLNELVQSVQKILFKLELILANPDKKNDDEDFRELYKLKMIASGFFSILQSVSILNGEIYYDIRPGDKADSPFAKTESETRFEVLDDDRLFESVHERGKKRGWGDDSIVDIVSWGRTEIEEEDNMMIGDDLSKSDRGKSRVVRYKDIGGIPRGKDNK